MVTTVTRVLFALLVGAVAVQRLGEVRRSRNNERRLLARGGREHAPRQLRWMKLLHGAWLIGMLVEVFALGRVFRWPLAFVALAVFALGQALRYAAMRALGERWTVRIVTVPRESVVTGGIYRWLRHPNYLGVALEIAALPLVHGAWITALAASVLNIMVLRRRIAAEERALSRHSDYDDAFGPRWSGA